MAGRTRRRFLACTLPAAASSGVLPAVMRPSAASGQTAPRPHSNAHAGFRGGQVDHAANGFDPHEILRDFDWGKTKRLPSGRVLREWEVVAGDRNVEVAPGVTFPAWTYNNRIPGPTFRAREGDRMRITFLNGSKHPHTIHFHGIHRAEMDGVPGIGLGQIEPGGKAVYEFDAEPFGLHLYHCHVRPLAEHIAKGMYGAFIVDPKEGRPEADEMVMVMHGFDTNFDRKNELYAVNGIAFAYTERPIVVKRGQRTRIYLVNVTEYDLINSLHVHAHFFDYYPTGTSRRPSELTDTVMLCQGQRGILELEFPYAGKFMFHAHQSEFTELGWQGFFDVRD